MKHVKTLSRFGVVAIYGWALYLFYFKYVPIVPAFQWALLPILFFLFLITFINQKWGTLLFIFLFPLINSLPYFFGIHDNIPHAPTALVLFLFYFLGYLCRKFLLDDPWDIRHPLFQPVLLFSLFIFISAILTFLRFSNFYPILLGDFFELATNIRGVSAGGAVMSTIFTGLNYLSGFAFLMIVFELLKKEGMRRKITDVFVAGAFLGLLFGGIQLLFDRELGNNLSSISHGLINGTFKDAMSFSGFIVLAFPFLAGIAVKSAGWRKVLAFLSCVLSLIMIVFTGSKIGLVCVVLSLFIMLGLSLFKTGEPRALNRRHGKKAAAILLLAALLIGAGAVVLIPNEAQNRKTAIARIQYMLDEGVFELFDRWRGPLWRGALTLLNSYPVSGIGCGAYIIDVANTDRDFFLYNTPQSAENYILQVAAEFGWVGIGFILWLFVILVTSIVRAMRRNEEDIKEKWFYWGTGIGLIFFFVILQFHTYIGSYEVKYTFWMLAAFVLSPSGNPVHSSRWNTKKLISLAAVFLVLAAAGVLYKNVTGGLSLISATKKYDLKHTFGLYPDEQTPDGELFNWTAGTAGIHLKTAKPYVRIRFQAAHPDIARFPVQVKFSLLTLKLKREIPLKILTVTDSDWHEADYDLSSYTNEYNVLLIRVSRTWNPKIFLGTDDGRNLGVAVRRLRPYTGRTE